MGNVFTPLWYELDKSNCIKYQNWTECLAINRQNILHRQYIDSLLVICLFIVCALASGFIIYAIHSNTAKPMDPIREFYRKQREKRCREVKNKRKLRENRLVNGRKSGQKNFASHSKPNSSSTTSITTPSTPDVYSPDLPSPNFESKEGKVAVLVENSGKATQNGLRKRWKTEMEDQQAQVDRMQRQQVYLYRMRKEIMEKPAKNR